MRISLQKLAGVGGGILTSRRIDGAPQNDGWGYRDEGNGFTKLTNEVQHLVKVLTWEKNIDISALKSGVKLADYKPRGSRSGRSLHIWIARHQQLLGS